MHSATAAKEASTTDQAIEGNAHFPAAAPLREVLHRLPFSRAPPSESDLRRADRLITQGFSPFDALRFAHAEQPIGTSQPQTRPSFGHRRWRVGIVVLTRQPHCFDWWLRYHRTLGIERVYTRVEATPDLREKLAATDSEHHGFVELLPSGELEPPSPDTFSPEFQAKIDSAIHSAALTGEESADSVAELAPLLFQPSGVNWWAATQMDKQPKVLGNYNTLMERQQRTVLAALARAQAAGIDWLFHIDDDELLHFSVPFSEMMASLPDDITCLTLQNVEAVPSSFTSSCIFEERSTFCTMDELFTSYRNGKSAGRVPLSDWQGPHRFTGEQYVVQTALARVLHYESATFDIWRAKFERHARSTGPDALDEVPFTFYRDSIRLFRPEVGARGGANDGSGSEAGVEGGVHDAALEKQHAFYRERKIELLARAFSKGVRFKSGAGGEQQATVMQFLLRPGESSEGTNTINQQRLLPPEHLPAIVNTPREPVQGSHTSKQQSLIGSAAHPAARALPISAAAPWASRSRTTP